MAKQAEARKQSKQVVHGEAKGIAKSKKIKNQNPKQSCPKYTQCPQCPYPELKEMLLVQQGATLEISVPCQRGHVACAAMWLKGPLPIQLMQPERGPNRLCECTLPWGSICKGSIQILDSRSPGQRQPKQVQIGLRSDRDSAQ